MEQRNMVSKTTIEPVESSSDLPDTTHQTKAHSKKIKKVNPVQSIPRDPEQLDMEEDTIGPAPQQEVDQELCQEGLKQIQIQFCQKVPKAEQVEELDRFLEETLQANTNEDIRRVVNNTSKEVIKEHQNTIIQVIWKNPVSGREYNPELIKDINKLMEVMEWGFGTPPGVNINSADDFIIMESEKSMQIKVQMSHIKEIENFLSEVFEDNEISELALEAIDVQRKKEISDWIQEIVDRKEVPDHMTSKIEKLRKLNGWTQPGKDEEIKKTDIQKVENFIKAVFKSNRTAKIQEEIFKYKDETIKEIKRITLELLHSSQTDTNLSSNTKLIKDITKLAKAAKWSIEKKEKEPKKKGKKDLKKKDVEDDLNKIREIQEDEIPNFEFSTNNSQDIISDQEQTSEEQVDVRMEIAELQSAKRKNEMDNQMMINPKDTKKRKVDEIVPKKGDGDKKEKFCIEVSKFSRKEDKIINNHIKPWNYETPKGFGIFIKGKGYQKGCVEKILNETEEEFGAIKNIFSDRAYTLVVMKKEQDREKMMEILKENQELEVESAKYRFPQIKFSVHESMLNQGVETLIEEVKKWNGLKKFKKEKLKLASIHPISNTKFVILVLEVHPHIRNYILDTLDGEIRVRNKSFTISDHFEIRKCRKCGSIKHGWCVNEKHCLNCAKVHNKDINCTHPRKCLTCKGGHKTFTLECPLYKREIENRMDFVDTTYHSLMMDRNF
uniref:Pre-C2HC domain-containing protein n=1 Tax=Tetranychus urticae TaxID=32264 RepID=T1KV05_TETUR